MVTGRNETERAPLVRGPLRSVDAGSRYSAAARDLR